MPDLDKRPLAGHKYTVLLAMLLATLVFQSFGSERPGGQAIEDLIGSVLLVAIFAVVFGHPRESKWVAVIVAGTIAIGWARHATAPGFEHVLAVAYQALIALFKWIAVVVILRALFRTPAIGGENVRGAICGYLIAGAAWGSVNALTYELAPAAYTFDPKVADLLADWHGRVALFSYYSFSQMLTMGYSDVTPVRPPATTLSLLAALFGVFYTAVVVSQLVGMAQASRSETRERR
jgi:hypothetical protein